jgi:uncharacterized protein YraI
MSMPERFISRATVGLLMLVTASLACNAQLGDLQPTAVAQAPSVVFIAPDNNSSLAEGAVIMFAVNVTNSGGISKVDFLVDDNTIGTQAVPPDQQATQSMTIQQSWTAKGVQGHFVDAVAYGADGKQFSDAKIAIQVVAGQPPTQATTADAVKATTPPPAATTLLPTNTAPPTSTKAPVGPTIIIVTSAPPTAAPTSEQPTLHVKAPNLNIRSGDGTNFPILLSMKTGDTAIIVGRNAAKSWWVVQKDQTRGWSIADPAFSDVTGDASKVPLVQSPPTPVATSIPTSAAVPTSTGVGTTADLVIDSVTLDPATPKANQTFTVNITIRNQGSVDAPASTVFGTFQPQNELSPGDVPAIKAGQSVNAQLKVTLKAGGANQNAVIEVDKYNTVAEGPGGEANNSKTITYNVNN